MKLNWKEWGQENRSKGQVVHLKCKLLNMMEKREGDKKHGGAALQILKTEIKEKKTRGKKARVEVGLKGSSRSKGNSKCG